MIGEIEESGRRVDRVCGLVRRLAPPYVDQSKLRVYVIDNKEWNAMAMGNGAIWIFSGIMDDMTDPELAIVVGHELAHYTHEHSRRQMKQGPLDSADQPRRRSPRPRRSTTTRSEPSRKWAAPSASARG